MEYFYKKAEPVVLREYGRIVQNYVRQLAQIQDRDKRSRMAHEVIRAMQMVAPSRFDTPEYRQKLWEQLMRIGQYELDIDTPVPVAKPEPLPDQELRRPPYYPHHARLKPYGKNVELLIQRAKQLPEGPEKQQFVLRIAQTIKMLQASIEGNTVNDAIVFDHLALLSEGAFRLNPQEHTLPNVAYQPRAQFTPISFKRKKKKVAMPMPSPASSGGGMAGPKKRKKRRF